MTPAEGNFSVLQESFFFFWQEEILYADPYTNIFWVGTDFAIKKGR